MSEERPSKEDIVFVWLEALGGIKPFLGLRIEDKSLSFLQLFQTLKDHKYTSEELSGSFLTNLVGTLAPDTLFKNGKSIGKTKKFYQNLARESKLSVFVDRDKVALVPMDTIVEKFPKREAVQFLDHQETDLSYVDPLDIDDGTVVDGKYSPPPPRFKEIDTSIYKKLQKPVVVLDEELAKLLKVKADE